MRFLRFMVRYVLPVLLVFAAVVFLLNTNMLAPEARERPLLIAHRGLGQTFSREGITGETCTANRIFPPEHPYLENTIAGIEAAFAAGADIVEFDVHPTTDGHFVVFHDWTVDCRTEGTGVTREHSLAELKALDVGYGYTADGGQTFPFRGKGVGLMPTLDEVLDAFPDRRFLINIKSNDRAEGTALAAKLLTLPDDRRERIMVYGGGSALDAFRGALPGLRTLGTDDARSCLLRYEIYGWLGIVPAPCRNAMFMLPANFTGFVWGWPNRLSGRLAANGTMLVVLGAYDGSGYTTGIDTVAELDDLPERFDGAIWTNRIDRIGPAVTSRTAAAD